MVRRASPRAAPGTKEEPTSPRPDRLNMAEQSETRQAPNPSWRAVRIVLLTHWSLVNPAKNYQDHVTVCLRVLRAARDAGARKFVVFGSSFTHFDRLLPELNLSVHHPYIRARRDQRETVLAEARPGFDTYVLELPYILGSLSRPRGEWGYGPCVI